MEEDSENEEQEDVQSTSLPLVVPDAVSASDSDEDSDVPLAHRTKRARTDQLEGKQSTFVFFNVHQLTCTPVDMSGSYTVLLRCSLGPPTLKIKMTISLKWGPTIRHFTVQYD